MANMTHELEKITVALAARGKGILAADESTPTITKRFQALQIESTEATRQQYRSMLVNTPHINQYIAGIILFEETLHQNTVQGMPFPERLKELNILPGIKVDKGLTLLPNTDEESITQGLDGLSERLMEYKKKGACFTKWRAVYRISPHTPSTLAIKANAEVLARYAALCQAAGMVPIVEPEVLIDGDHTLEQCEAATLPVLHAVFNALYRHRVQLEHIVLKPSMVISGKQCTNKASADAVAAATLRVLRQTVPAAVRTINFLSGGQTPEEATTHLNLMNQSGREPWHLSFSYARALQDPAMKAWKGQESNVATAQTVFLKRAQLNSLASCGQYHASLEAKEAQFT
jgi:fructose-bisphosphate aldolase class I